MMIEKINLTLEKNIKEKAKRMACSLGMSVSEMVEKLISSIDDDPEDKWLPDEGSIVSQMAGSIPNKEHLDYKDLLSSELMKKEGFE